MGLPERKDWRYNGKYDADILELVNKHNYGAYTIYHILKQGLFEFDISLSTVARRVRALKQQKGNT